MTRKATAKKPATKTKPKTASKSKSASKAKKPAKPKSVIAYVVRRRVPAENDSYTEPERLFGTKAAAQKFAAERNAELQAMTNPFERHPHYEMTGGEAALLALVKKLGLTPPKKPEGASEWLSLGWEGWWDASYFNMTEDQREAIWDALDKFDWYHVAATELE
jgi:hypothetical protein